VVYFGERLHLRLHFREGESLGVVSAPGLGISAEALFVRRRDLAARGNQRIQAKSSGTNTVTHMQAVCTMASWTW